jgi:enamine deaminase RidA (YjgF/YER057c/UK114 family)
MRGLADSPEVRLREAGLELPDTAGAAGGYAPAVSMDGLLFISGQTPRTSQGMQYVGIVGESISEEQARSAATLCALRILAAAKVELGELSRVRRVLKLTVFIRSTPGHGSLGVIADRASEVMATAFGSGGTHARSTVGVSALPAGASVEIEAVLAISHRRPR